MTTDDCTSIEFLLQADFDGELDVAGSASLAAHLAHCPDCQAKQAELSQLSVRMRTELPYYAAPAALRGTIEAMISRAGVAEAPIPQPVQPRRPVARRPWHRMFASWMQWGMPFGAGAALAAVVALVAVLPRGGEMTDSVIASHIRALQPGHLMDVVSTDQHTVKPWFDGRLDYAPPVKDLASQGFPLIGGRLDYLAGRPVAALAYRRAQHMIDLYVWPSSSHIDAAPGSGERSGYNFIRWQQDEMVFWAVSDVSQADLADFVKRWRAAQ